MMNAGPATLPTVIMRLVLVVCAALLAGIGAMALRRNSKQEGLWTLLSAAAMLGMGASVQVSAGSINSFVIACGVPFGFLYLALYGAIRAHRSRLNTTSACRAGVISVAAGFAINALVLVYFLNLHRPAPGLALAPPWVAAAVLTIVAVDIARSRRLADYVPPVV